MITKIRCLIAMLAATGVAFSPVTSYAFLAAGSMKGCSGFSSPATGTTSSGQPSWGGSSGSSGNNSGGYQSPGSSYGGSGLPSGTNGTRYGTRSDGTYGKVTNADGTPAPLSGAAVPAMPSGNSMPSTTLGNVGNVIGGISNWSNGPAPGSSAFKNPDGSGGFSFTYQGNGQGQAISTGQTFQMNNIQASFGGTDMPVGSAGQVNFNSNGGITGVSFSTGPTAPSFASVSIDASGNTNATLSGTYNGAGQMHAGNSDMMVPGGIGDAMYADSGLFNAKAGDSISATFVNGQASGLDFNGGSQAGGQSFGSADFSAAGISSPALVTPEAGVGGLTEGPLSVDLQISGTVDTDPQNSQQPLPADQQAVTDPNNQNFQLGTVFTDTNFQIWADVTGAPGSTFVLVSGDPNNPASWQTVSDPTGNPAQTTTDGNGNGAIVTGPVNMYGTGNLYIMDAGTNQIVGTVNLGNPTSESVGGDAKQSNVNLDTSFDRMWSLGYTHPYQALENEGGMIVPRSYTDAAGVTHVTQDTQSSISEWRAGELLCSHMGNVFAGNAAQYFPVGWDPNNKIGQNIANFNAMTTGPDGIPVCPFLGEFQTFDNGKLVNLGLMGGSMLIPAGIIEGNKVFEGIDYVLHGKGEDITNAWHNSPWFQITTFNSPAEEYAYSTGGL